MYHSNPVTYFLRTMASVGLAGVPVVCAGNELLHINPPLGQSCSSYLDSYMSHVGGRLINRDAESGCQFCPVKDTDVVLARLGIYFGRRWTDFGISLGYTIINILGALGLYWLFRVPRRAKTGKKK